MQYYVALKSLLDMIKKKQYSLVNIIYNDLCIYGSLQLFLLLLVLISAMLVVIVTHQTRCMVIYREELLLKKRAVDIEWNSLILEEKMLSHHSRIESIATDVLHMCHVKITRDEILIDL